MFFSVESESIMKKTFKKYIEMMNEQKMRTYYCNCILYPWVRGWWQTGLGPVGGPSARGTCLTKGLVKGSSKEREVNGFNQGTSHKNKGCMLSKTFPVRLLYFLINLNENIYIHVELFRLILSTKMFISIIIFNYMRNKLYFHTDFIFRETECYMYFVWLQNLTPVFD